jgi:hypothetical protein
MVRFQVLTAVSMKVTAFRNVAVCSLAETDRCLRGAHCLHLQGDRPETTWLEDVTFQLAVIFNKLLRSVSGCLLTTLCVKTSIAVSLSPGYVNLYLSNDCKFVAWGSDRSNDSDDILVTQLLQFCVWLSRLHAEELDVHQTVEWKIQYRNKNVKWHKIKYHIICRWPSCHCKLRR